MLNNNGIVLSITSPKHGIGGKTVLTAAIGFMMADIIKEEVLITDHNYRFTDMNTYLGVVASKTLDDVLNLAEAGKLDKQIFKIHTTNIFKNVNILPGSITSLENNLEKKVNKINNFLDCSKAAFEVTMVDCNATDASNKSLYTRNLLKKSDVVIVALEQDALCVDRYLKSNLAKLKNKIIVINKYDDIKIQLNIDAIKKLIGKEETIFTLPISYRLKNSTNSYSLSDYLLNDSDAYIAGVRNICKYIATQYEYIKQDNIPVDEEVKGKKQFMFSLPWKR
ncbi:MAG: hypothetical protein AB7G87_04930 [Clostridia bacterium]